jgi:septal ring-binding cell division protein DamX
MKRVVVLGLLAVAGAICLTVIAVRTSRQPLNDTKPKSVASVNTVPVEPETAVASAQNKPTPGQPVEAPAAEQPGATQPRSAPPPGATFSRPEERGKQYGDASTQELVRMLGEVADKIELRKFANELGNRSISGTLDLSSDQAKVVGEYVGRLLNTADDRDPNVRSEARCQIARLWHAAVPACIAAVTDTKNSKRRELAAESLILMRNRDIVAALISKGQQTTDPKERYCIHWALARMERQRTTVVDNRACLNEETSRKLFVELIVPALADLEQKGISEP